MREPDAAVAILHAREPEEAVLLIRRAEREGDPWSGHWSLPGGRRETFDRDIVETALRETAEECGITLPRELLERPLPHMQARRATPPFMLVAPFVFHVTHQLSTTTDPQEAVEAVWVPLRTLRDPGNHVVCPVPGMPRNLLFPAIDLKGQPLWGFTYRLLAEWLGLVPPDSASAGRAALAGMCAYLASLGLQLRQAAADRIELTGAIPVTGVLEYLARSHRFPRVARVEVTESALTITDLAGAECRVVATTPTNESA